MKKITYTMMSLALFVAPVLAEDAKPAATPAANQGGQTMNQQNAGQTQTQKPAKASMKKAKKKTQKPAH